MTQYLTIKNWEDYQHYKDRCPPWIKLHRGVLDDYDMSCLQDASKLHLILIWLLSSQLNNRIPNDPEWVGKKIGAKSKVNLKELIDKGFLIAEQNASKPLAKCSPETEAYREETEKRKKEDFILPDWIQKDDWDAFMEVRKEKKAADTLRAKNSIVNELQRMRAKGIDIHEVLQKSIRNSWKDVFEPKPDINGKEVYKPKPEIKPLSAAEQEKLKQWKREKGIYVP